MNAQESQEIGFERAHAGTFQDEISNYAEAHYDRIEESLEDCLKQSLLRWKGDLPRTMAEFSAAVIAIVGMMVNEATGAEGDIYEILDKWAKAKGNAQSDKFIFVISDIINHPKPIYRVDTFAFALGLRLRQGVSGAELAKRHGVSRQAFSKATLEVVRAFNLPVTSSMKSEIASLNYKLTNKKRTSCS